MRRFRVNKNESKIKKRRVIDKVAAYKHIPHHMHIISFEHVTFCEQKELNSELMFYISFCKDMICHFVNKLFKSKCLWTYHLKMLSRK